MRSEKEMVTGRMQYIDDIVMDGMLHMTVVRSPYSFAKINAIRGGLNHTDFNSEMKSFGEGEIGEETGPGETMFAGSHAFYAGQPVAAVFGKTKYESEDNADSVEVDYEPLKPIMNLNDSLKLGPVHGSMKSNVLKRTLLGKEFSIADSHIDLSDSFMMERIATNPIEGRGLVCHYDGNKLNVWISGQSMHSIKSGLCGTLNLPPDRVRVFHVDTGGAFGLKGGMYPEYAIAGFASMKYGKPVKWIETRREHLMASKPGRGVRGDITISARKDGKILGLKGKVLVDAGAFGGSIAEFSPRFIGYQITGPYAIGNVYVDAQALVTNKPPQGPYRGAGRPEASFLMERMIDRLADETGLDPVDIRLTNAATEPFKTPTGMMIPESRSFLQDAIRELGYRNFRKPERPGFSFFALLPASSPGEGARIRCSEGKVKVWLGGNTHGQGHEFFVKSLLSTEFRIDPGLITLEYADTDMLEKGEGSWGSRSAMVGGNAIIELARRIIKRIEKEEGHYAPEILLDGEYDEQDFVSYKKTLISYGANLVTADVDTYGNVHVKECRSYYDVGRALVPHMVRGQIIGGCMQGIGQTLYEEISYSEDGTLLTGSISDAGLPTAEKIPEFTVKYAENPSEFPHGAKGLGESPTIGVPTALARAIELASGKRIRNTPVRPDYLIG